MMKWTNGMIVVPHGFKNFPKHSAVKVYADSEREAAEKWERELTTSEWMTPWKPDASREKK